VIRETAKTISRASKDLLRKFVPDLLLTKRDIACRLGPKAGRIYARLCLLDVLRLRTSNKRLVPQSARAFVFVCHGNIIRSPFAERLIADGLTEGAVSVTSAGLGAENGRPSPDFAVAAAARHRINLRGHGARRLTPADVAAADVLFVMDVQQQLALVHAHPSAAGKVFLLASLAADTPLAVHDPVDDDAPLFDACYAHIARAVEPIVRHLSRQTC